MEKRNNFVITGYGRSGTKYLSYALNTSSSWTVNHEPRGDKDEKQYRNKNYNLYYSNLKTELNKNNYGEVNSYLRFFLKNLVEDFNTGVILREPKDILKSVMNRKNYDQQYKFLISDLREAYRSFEYLNYKTVFFDFNEIIKNLNYVNRIGSYFNINDLNLQNIEGNKNQNKNIKYRDFDSLPEPIKKYFFNTFGNEYNLSDYFTFKTF